jgi:hypothetical protein
MQAARDVAAPMLAILARSVGDWFVEKAHGDSCMDAQYGTRMPMRLNRFQAEKPTLL